MFTAEFSHDVSATPSTIWKLYADVSRWPHWDEGTERIDLTGAFANGSRGTMHFKGGQAVDFELAKVVPCVEFTDVAKLGPTTVKFAHLVTPLADQGGPRSRVTHRIEVEGPDAQTMGAQITSDVPASLQNIARLAEAKPMSLTSLYVNDVKASTAFLENAFGLVTRFKTENGMYCEFEGDVPLTLVSRQFIADMMGQTFASAPAPMSIGFVVDDVTAAWNRAVQAGARSLHAPEKKPWGQVTAHVLTPDGFIVELCTSWR